MSRSFIRLAVICAAFVPTIAAAQSNYTYATRYDVERRVTGTIAPDPDGAGSIKYAAVRTTYDAKGLPTRVESGELATWQAETVVPANWTGFTVQRTVDTEYDLAGRKTRERASNGATVFSVSQYSYDGMNRVVCTAIRLNPALWLSQTDACVPQLTGPNGPDRITKNIYDAAGQLIQVRKAFGVTTANGAPKTLEQAYATYAYSPNGKPTVSLDANGNRTEMVYDGFDRLERMKFPSQSALNDTQRASFAAATPATALTLSNAVNANDYEQYGYDANGNRTSLRKRDGRTLTFAYDALNRLTVKTVPDGCPPIMAGTNVCPLAAATPDVYYGYDLLGRQLYARYGGHAATNEGVTNGYDGLGRLTSSTQLMGGTSRTLTYAHDLNSNRTRLTFPDGQAFSFAYDGLDRMKGIDVGPTQGAGALTAIGYDNQGRREAMGFGGASIATNCATPASQAAATMRFCYDPASRLQALGHMFTGGTGNVSLGFAYNPASQIVSETRDNDAYVWGGNYNVVRGYAANGLNQYTSAGPASFTYDANGNLTSDGSVTYAYDVENRIIGASGAKSATLKYDPLGRLYEVSSGLGGTRFLYDIGAGAAAGVDPLLAEYDLTSGSLQRRYVHGPGLDEPLIWYEGAELTNRRNLHANHQGSIIAVASSSGTQIAANSYDPYGIPGLYNMGRFQYTGQIYLPELGLYHYKARAYSPTLGRFLQTDPIGTKDDLNLYAYVGNDPINGRDPTGNEGFYDDYVAPVLAFLAPAITAKPIAGPVKPRPPTAGGPAVAVGTAIVYTGTAAVAAGAAYGSHFERTYVKRPSLSWPAPTRPALSATAHGNSDGSPRPTDLYHLVNRSTLAIDKIGVSSDIQGGRYSASYLAKENVIYQVVRRFESRYPAKVAENIDLTHYELQFGQLPRLNRVRY